MLHYVISDQSGYIQKLIVPTFNEATDMFMLINIDSVNREVLNYSVSSIPSLHKKLVKNRNKPGAVAGMTSKVDDLIVAKMIGNSDSMVVHSSFRQDYWLGAILGVLKNIGDQVAPIDLKDGLVSISDILDDGSEYFSGSSFDEESDIYITMSAVKDYSEDLPVDEMTVSPNSDSFVGYTTEKKGDQSNEDEGGGDEEGELKEESVAKGNTGGVKRDLDGPEDDKDAKKPKADTVPSGEEEILKMITLISDATVYEGFSPDKVRSKFIDSYPDVNLYTKYLAMIFVAYARIGNNIGKLNQKRVDPAKATELMRSVELLGMKKKASKSDTLTLPRMAIAFMPEYLAFRKNIMKDLQVQADTTLNVVYQDVAFAGCDAISSMVGYTEFYDQFSKLITNGGKGVASDEKAEKKYVSEQARWRKVAKSGFVQDSLLRPRMTAALLVPDASSTIKFIYASHAAYGAVSK